MLAGGRAACQGAAWGRARKCSSMMCGRTTCLMRHGSRSHTASSRAPGHSFGRNVHPAASGLEQAVTASTDTLHWYEQSPMFYSNYPLDRAPALRKDPALLQQLLQLPAARTMLVNGRKLLVQTAANTPNGTSSAHKLSPVWFENPASYLAAAGDPSVGPLFLGLDPETSAPCFAIQVKPSAEAGLTSEEQYSWSVARNVGPSMCAADAALAAVATGLAQWNLDAQYHGSSGKQTVSTDAGFSRSCEDSGRTVYPRIDPAIITLVTAGSDWCLLGRKEGWPTGRYSTLAGFLELGETLEQALAREVLEEAGVAVEMGSIRYQASQPWPFPRSLMVGFYASLSDQQPAGSSSNGGVTEANTSSSREPYDPTRGAYSSGSSAVGADGRSSSPSSSTASKEEQREEAALRQLCQLGRSALREQRMRPAALVPYLLPKLPNPVPQPGEMSDVRWFHRDWLSWAISNEGQAPGSFAIPGPYSLAHHLITGWLQQQGPTGAEAAPSSGTSTSSTGGNGHESADNRHVADLQQQQHQPVAAAAPREFGTAATGWVGDQIPQVKLDPGIQKYVLLQLNDTRSERSRLLVWGATAAAYHNHILQEAKSLVYKLHLADELTVDVLGGGRIEHYPEQQVLSVYGYSAAFGPAPHEVTAAILRRWFPFYAPDGISISYQGY